MVYQSSPVTTTQWIESWQQRLTEVVDHVQPWTAAAGRGIPGRARNQPMILELVESMETGFVALLESFRSSRHAPWILDHCIHRARTLRTAGRGEDIR